MIVRPGKFKIHELGCLGTQAGFMYCSFEAVSLLLWETLVFAHRAFGWLVRPAYVMEGFFGFSKEAERTGWLGGWVRVGVLVTQLCLTLCDPMDCSPSGSSVHGILQARILEWVAISFSRNNSSKT